MTAVPTPAIGLCLGGDVMTGRGIDQVLPRPADPTLYEPYIRDARQYVRLAEAVSGPIPRPLDVAAIWGDALAELAPAAIDLRIVNLETSITTSADAWPDKGIHYRMHPANVGCLTAARLDCCCLANNHVLDWGYAGLTETIATLDRAGIAHAGAGENAAAAAAPAALDVAGGRVLVFAVGATTSGIPPEWGAAPERPGVNLLPNLTESTARRLARQIEAVKRPGDVAVVSIHWGGNWGYEVPEAHVRFAHRLIEGGIDVVHGHSSHHVKALEVYQARLILYGCGDLLDDYEGISGHEAYRPDLRLLYLVRLDPATGRLVEARLVPVQVRGFQLRRAAPTDAAALGRLLNRLGEPFGTRTELAADHTLTLVV